MSNINAAEIYATSVVTNELDVVGNLTDLQWSPVFKNASIALLNTNTTAKLSYINNGNKGILGATSYLIGTDEDDWVYKVDNATVLQIGMALTTVNLSILDNTGKRAVVQYATANDSIIHMVLKEYISIYYEVCSYTISGSFSGLNIFIQP